VGGVAQPISEQSAAAPRYGNSLRKAVHTGRYRDQLGSCIQTVNWDGELVSCSQPCQLQPASRTGSDGLRRQRKSLVTRDQVELSCRQLVRQLTAMIDPTAAGSLSIQIDAEDNSGAAIRSSQVPAHSHLLCGVTTTGNRPLRGSLLALGRQPIPWA